MWDIRTRFSWLLIVGLGSLCQVQAVIKGINLFGYETEHMAMMCDWVHSVSWNIQKIKDLGFNSIRLPFSYDFVQRGDYSQMDQVFESAGELDVDVVLDYHRLRKTHQSYSPISNPDITFDQFLKSWRTILNRYVGYKNLVAVDIWNEYQGNNFAEWNNLARQIVNYLESQFPNRLTYYVGGVGWGGNVYYMDLEDLPFSDRIRYSIHKYQFSDSEKYEDKWDYSFSPNKTIMNVGEFGYKSDQQIQVDWVKRFIAYLRKVGVRDTFFWCWSPNSQDTGGILLDNCNDVDTSKIAMLNTLWKDDVRYLRGNATAVLGTRTDQQSWRTIHSAGSDCVVICGGED